MEILYVNEAFQNGASLVIANNQKKSKKKNYSR